MIKVPAIVEKMRGEPLGNPVNNQFARCHNSRQYGGMKYCCVPVWAALYNQKNKIQKEI